MWQIKGCVEALEDHNSNVCSVYSSKYVTNVYPTIQRLSAGNAVFTFPVTPVKCAGAAQKICYLAEEHVTQVRLELSNQLNGDSLGLHAHRTAPLMTVV